MLYFFYNYHKLGAMVNVCIAEGLTTINPKVQIFQDSNHVASVKTIPFKKPGLNLQKWQRLLLRHQVHLFTKTPL